MPDDVRPVPDPTVLTTEAQERIRRAEREWTVAQLDVIRQRLSDMDRATDLLDETVTRTPTLIQTEISHVRELMDERQMKTAQGLAAAEKAVETAMTAAEKAVAKAEVANEKRFESVDVFRRQLSDQMAGVMSRNEADVRIGGISEKLDIESHRTAERFNELELRLTSRLDLMQGNKQGGQETKAGIYALGGFIASLVVIIGVLAAAGVFSK